MRKGTTRRLDTSGDRRIEIVFLEGYIELFFECAGNDSTSPAGQNDRGGINGQMSPFPKLRQIPDRNTFPIAFSL